MPGVVRSAGDVKALGDKILLPSSFTSEERVKHGLQRLARLEYKIREADAYDALHALKLSLREIAYQVSRFGKDGYGKRNNTRRVRAQKDAHQAKREHAAVYRCAHQALVCLGMHAPSSNLKELKEEDMYRPSVQDPHELGSGKKTAGWIWAVGHSGKEQNDWEQEGTRIHDLGLPCANTVYRG